ncbi:MAG: S8 family serine peptidase, partial [Candidatus Parabeggiatoa sp.]|nr:S8 family serine peptidase [Candidatus Parabeggiatoa sp.]
SLIEAYHITGSLLIRPQIKVFILPENFLPKKEGGDPPPSESETVSETEPTAPSPSEPLTSETDTSAPSEEQPVAETRRTRKRAEYWPGRVIVKFHKEISTEKKSRLRAFFQADLIRELSIIQSEVWQVENVEAAIATQSRQAFSNIVSIRPDYVIRAQDIRTINNTLRRKSRDKEAISIETKAPVLCAVLDSGVDYTHPDLKPYIWTNPGEIPNNGIDDDGNGYVDDVHGYDFINDDSDPMDDCGHGTHVAGIVANLANKNDENTDNDENTGVITTGYGWPAQIIALKILRPEITRHGTTDCKGSSVSAILALEYVQNNAKNMGIKCSNNSWGGDTFDEALFELIQKEKDEGRLFIVAAGNDKRQDNDLSPFYPANYDLDNVISVCSVDKDNNLSLFSNFGQNSVDLCALGEEIESTFPGENYVIQQGTSMAAPYVMGAITVLWSAYPNLTWSEVKKHILASAERFYSLTTSNVTGGRLNLRQAVQNINSQRQTFTIYNTGHTDLKIDEVRLAGEHPGEFQIRYDGCSSQKLAPRTNCTVDVSFEPTSEGNKNARLEVISNTPVQQTIVASLSSRLNTMITSLATGDKPPPPPQKPLTDLAPSSIYNVKTGELDIPTVARLKGNEETGVMYQVKLSMVEGKEPLHFKVLELTEYDNPKRKLGDSLFDETTGQLNIPFVELGENSRIFYEIDMGMVTTPEIEFELQKAIPIH